MNLFVCVSELAGESSLEGREILEFNLPSPYSNYTPTPTSLSLSQKGKFVINDGGGQES